MNDAQPSLMNIVGERVALGPFSREIAPLLRRWLNDFPTARFGGFPDPLEPWSDERVQSFLGRALTDPQRVWFAVFERESGRAIGHANLRDMDMRHGTAEIGLTIGDPADRGKGFGTEATRLLLDYAFTALGLTNVLLDTFEFNAAAIRAYEKAGFKLIGRRRAAYVSAGRAWDVLLMDCLASEFTSPVLAGLLGGGRDER